MEIVQGRDLACNNVLMGFQEGLLKCLVLLLIPGIDQVFQIFIVRETEKYGSRNARALNEETFALVCDLIENLPKMLAQRQSSDFLRQKALRFFHCSSP